MCWEEAEAKAEGRLDAFTQGRREEPPGAPVGSRHAGTQLLPEAGTEDHEHPLNTCQTRPSKAGSERAGVSSRLG